MTLNQIIYFAKTAERMHMASAAKELMIAQPSLSMSLSKLEDELGVALFEKRGRGIALTSEGKCFLHHAHRIIEDVNAANLEMRRIREQAETSLTVAYINPLSEHFLPRLFRDFKAQIHGEPVRLNSVEMNTGEIIQALQNNTVDLAFCSQINDHDELTQISILQQPMVLIVPKGHRLEREYRLTGQPLNCQALEGEAFITYLTHSPMYRFVRAFFRARNITPDFCHFAYNETAIADLVAEGMGIALLAKVDELPWKQVVELPLEGLDCSREIYLTYRTKRKMFRTARQMLNFIRLRYGIENFSIESV